jgi:hypothetical protein
MLPKYLAMAIQAGIENPTGRSKFLNVDTLSIDGPAAKAVGGNQALKGELFNQCSCQVTWTYYARSLSEAPRAMKIDEWRDAGPGALSIEPLEVSRWRGEQDVLGYGF